jgi:L-cysteate sulfo-lyase
MGYETLARVSLANLPTPLEELKQLREKIGGPRIFIKRDDLTGLGLGGNKLRKLEFLLGDALAKKCDTIITSGTIQTNHGRLTAAACAKLGLTCYLVLTDEDTGIYEGNRILESLYGARQVFCGFDHSVAPELLDKEKLRAGDERISRLVAELKTEGKNPYVIPRGGRSLFGTAGYVAAMDELKLQLDSFRVHPDYIVSPCATSSTITGISLGNRVSGINAHVIGAVLSRSAAENRKMLMEEFNHDAEAMGYPFRITKGEIDVREDYLGPGYASMTEAGKEAILLFARTEGILLDPVYTGKTAAAYVDMVHRGEFKTDDTVILFHTGGTPLLFLRSMADWAKEIALEVRT